MLTVYAVVICLTTVLCWKAYFLVFARVNSFAKSTDQPPTFNGTDKNGRKSLRNQDLGSIDSLAHHDWEKTKPLQLRPYKPKMFLTMGITSPQGPHDRLNRRLTLCPGISNATVSQLIEMDWHYLERIQLRRDLMTQHPEVVLAADRSIKPAVDEFYGWIFGVYLPLRFPRMFRKDMVESQPVVRNLITSETLPLSPPCEPLEALRALGAHLDDDFLFMLPSSDGDGYRLRGFVTCFPNGFNTRKKLGMSLREIHTPVPGYKQRIALSMDRFFERLEVGKFVQRANVRTALSDMLGVDADKHV